MVMMFPDLNPNGKLDFQLQTKFLDSSVVNAPIGDRLNALQGSPAANGALQGR